MEEASLLLRSPASTAPRQPKPPKQPPQPQPPRTTTTTTTAVNAANALRRIAASSAAANAGFVLPLTASSAVIAEARASLRHPTRPFTPKTSRDAPLHDRRRAPPRRLDPIAAVGLTASRDRQSKGAHLQPRATDESNNKSPSSNSDSHRTRSNTVSPDPRDEATTTSTAAWQRLSDVLSNLPTTTSPTSPSIDETLASLHADLDTLNWLRINPDDPKGSRNDAPAVAGGRRMRDKERREFALGKLMPWMEESGDVGVAVGVCATLLRLTHDERVHLSCSKLLFKLSKSERNDVFFSKNRVLDHIMYYIDPPPAAAANAAAAARDRTDAHIYLTGAMKNVSNDASCATVLSSAPISATSRLSTSTLSNWQSQHPQLLIQTTAILRNLAGHVEISRDVAAIASVIAVCDCEIVEAVWNSTRLLRHVSKLSLCEEWWPVLGGKKNVELYSRILGRFQTHKPLLIRVVFVLGNLTSATDLIIASESRKGLRDAIPDLVALFGVVVAVGLRVLRGDDDPGWVGGGGGCDIRIGEEDDGGREVRERADKESLDLLVKLIRLLANIAIDPVGGREISEMIELESLLDVLDHAKMSVHEELVLNTIAALANFTYYVQASNIFLHDTRNLERILSLMSRTLLFNNKNNSNSKNNNDSNRDMDGDAPHPEAIDESTRVIANISRSRSGAQQQRRWMHEGRGLELLVTLLEIGDRDAVVNVCGALSNWCDREEDRGGRRCAEGTADAVARLGGVSRLIAVVEASLKGGDLALALVSARALNNIAALGSTTLTHATTHHSTVSDDDDYDDDADDEADEEARSVNGDRVGSRPAGGGASRWFSDDEEERLAILMLDFIDVRTHAENEEEEEEVEEEEEEERRRVMALRRIAANTLKSLGYGDTTEEPSSMCSSSFPSAPSSAGTVGGAHEQVSRNPCVWVETGVGPA